MLACSVFTIILRFKWLVLAQVSSKDYSILFSIGCVQSVYGIHTLRVESIAHGKASPVDELRIQGVSNPSLLRKVRQTLSCMYFEFATYILCT